jgi:hypothetical protein
MARSGAPPERLDDHHAGAAMRAGMVNVLRGGCVSGGPVARGRWTNLGRRGDALAGTYKLLGTRNTAIVVELGRLKRHDLAASGNRAIPWRDPREAQRRGRRRVHRHKRHALGTRGNGARPWDATQL